MSFSTVLVANRGEIARRIFRTCKRLGYKTVAVYSDADREAPFVREADYAVHLGGAPSAESYLNTEKVLRAARESGADAIHPGYGFLSENAEFVEAVTAAGLIFVGPSAQSMRVMGDKAEARQFMSAAGVSVTPGYDGEDQDDTLLEEKALTIGLPVMVKAAAGGGGKGMSIVYEETDLIEAFGQARRLALNAFGSDRLILEKYIETPRHLEVQVLGDQSGQVIHVFERECSVQRRFQKVVEEAPAPNLSLETQAKLHAAAVKAAQQVQYVGAGTVEFIADQNENFYFLEMNTRLQVEHPVSEMITGLDLVEWQLRVAAGEHLPKQSEVRAQGHAIEVRLYAEDPASDYLPSVGTVTAYRETQGAGIRFDSGVVLGSEISIYYDPMLAKVIAHGDDREQARRRLTSALQGYVVEGMQTNLSFLIDVLAHPIFVKGHLDTGFLARDFSSWQYTVDPHESQEYLAALVAFTSLSRRMTDDHLPLAPGWRLFNGPPITDEWTHLSGETCGVRYQWESSRQLEVVLDDNRYGVDVVAHGRTWVRLEFETDTRSAWQRRFEFVQGVEGWHVLSVGGSHHWTESPRFPDAEIEAEINGCISPMPGRIVRLLVEAGTTVSTGTPLVVLEAMKMEQTLEASANGTVDKVCVAEGDLVSAQETLVEITYEEA